MEANMLRYWVAIVTSVVFLLLIKCVSPEPKLSTDESNCRVTDIHTHLKSTTQFIEAAFQNVKELCKMTVSNSAPDYNKREEGISAPPRECPEIERPHDCSDIYQKGNHVDGIFDIWPQCILSSGYLNVYCDMTTDGGGWTVIQRRGDFGNSQDYFYKNWTDYQSGFGNLLKEFWIGNDNIFRMTNQRLYQLRVELTNWDETTTNFTLDQFWIDDESNNYKLHVSAAPSGVGYGLTYLHGLPFSTEDRDNDQQTSSNIATEYKGGWWYPNNVFSNLNGPRLAATDMTRKGMIWYYWGNSYRSLKASAMKIRPANFHQNAAL